MRDVNNEDHRQPRRVEMPLISIPTETVHPHVVRPDEEPPSTTDATHLGTSGFDVGIDTCGFTTDSTVTCEFGYDCTNVGDYRGCCVAGAADCVATIYTECIDHEKAPNSDGCGQHTLCCPDSKPYCFVYAYSTDSDPDATLTYVECQESEGFGEMFPFPPELMTMTSNSSTTETGSSSDSSSPDSATDEPEPEPSSSHSSRNAGAIIGGVVGGVVFILLIILAAFLLLRYRRRRRQAKLRASIIPLGPAKTPQSSTDASPDTEKSQAQAQTVAAPARSRSKTNPTPTHTPTSPRTAHKNPFRPLSSIHEHPHPTIPPTTTLATPTPSTTLGRNKSTSAATTSSARGSYGPNWPLGPSNPLAAHPVDANLKKRLSDSRLGTLSLAQALAAGSGMGMGMGMEGMRVRPLDLGRTTRTPPPPPGSRPAPLKSPGSVGGGLRSPRLDFVSVSPIVGRIEDGGGAKSVGPGMGAEPVSPIESDDEGGGEDTQRLSYVSAPSAHFEGDDLVSPVSPHVGRDEDGDSDGGRVSPRTVSPLESRRGSEAS